MAKTRRRPAAQNPEPTRAAELAEITDPTARLPGRGLGKDLAHATDAQILEQPAAMRVRG